MAESGRGISVYEIKFETEDEMKRILLKVAYDGSDFHGWQVQPGVRTVEGELNRALSELTKEEITVIGASRTDAGVHSLGNIAVFDTDSTIPPERFSYALNTLLPEDVKVVCSKEVAEDFHPRKVNCRKIYEYRISLGEFPNPLKRRNSWYVPYALDTEAMNKAAQVLVGEHDFAGFCSVHTQAESTVRTVYSVEVEAAFEPKKNNKTKKENAEKTDAEIVIRICGNGFLYNMVRIIAGTLVEVGSGKRDEAWVREALESADRTKSGPTAPPQGLTLVEIIFEE